MSTRLSLAISLLAALGIHAVILLVPRVAVSEAPIPTIELDLAIPAALIETVPAVARKIATVAEPAVALATEPVPRRETMAPAAPNELVSVSSIGNEPVLDPVQGDPAAQAASSAAPSAGVPSGAGDGAGPPALSGSTTQVATAPVLVPPRPRSGILPAYPRSARRSGLEGVVKVAVVVNESGAVTAAEVFATSGHAALDQAAIEAVRRALFAPALQEGKPVLCRVVIPIRFQLKPQENAP